MRKSGPGLDDGNYDREDPCYRNIKEARLDRSQASPGGMRRLERYLQTVLDFAWSFVFGSLAVTRIVRVGANHIAAGRRTRGCINGVVHERSSLSIAQELHVIKHIKEVHAELHRETLPHVEVLVDSQVRIADGRPKAVSYARRTSGRAQYISDQGVPVGIQPLVLWATVGSARLPPGALVAARAP